jgi:poly(A) polymerase
LRAQSGEAPQELIDWWTRFQSASHEERQAMLKPDEGPKKRRRPRSRGRKRRAESAGQTPAPGDEP